MSSRFVEEPAESKLFIGSCQTLEPVLRGVTFHRGSELSGQDSNPGRDRERERERRETPGVSLLHSIGAETDCELLAITP